MAVVVVEDNATRAETFEGSPTINGINVGGSGAKELVTFYQGSASGSAKATSGTKDAGFVVTTSGTHDIRSSATNKTWMVKYFISDGSDLDSDGMKLRAGNTGSDYFETYVHDDGTAYGTYPPTTSWLILPWTVSMSEYHDNTGVNISLDLSVADEFTITGQWTTGGAKSENIFMDSIDLSNGLWLTRGDSTDPDATFEDFWDDDEGDTSGTTGRYGHVTKPNQLDGIYQVFGTLVIGRTQGGSTANPTVFTDSNKTIVFPGGRVDSDWNKLEIDISNSSTDINVSSSTFTGTGNWSGTKQRFRTAAGTVGTSPGIDTTPDEIEFDTGSTDLVPHGFVTGQPLLYSKEGGTATTGLTDATVYYAIEGTTSTRLGLATTRINAYAGTTIALTATAGEEHSLLTNTIVRPNLEFTGSVGSGTFTSCGFVGWDTFTLTTGATFNASNFIGARLIDLDTTTGHGGTLLNCNFSEMINDVGEALVVVDDLENIEGCSFTHFTQGGDANGTFNRSGHAIEITDATNSPFSFVNNSFTDYGPNRAEFDTITGIDAGTDVITTDAVHGFTTGDPVYYDQNGTDTIGVTDGALYYVRVLSTTTLTLHPSWADATENTNTENLNDGATGETHYLYSGFAAIVNNSGSAITINYSGPSATAPTVRNIGASTTTVASSVSITMNIQEQDGTAVQDAQCSIYLASDNSEVLNADSSALGVASGSFSGTTPAAIYWRVRKGSTGATKYVKQSGLGTIESGTGFAVTVTLAEDTINST